MVPSTHVWLARLPLTPNGKVDRQRLPAPVWSATARAPGQGAPRTPIEAELARIWADVLGLEHVRIDENFFELGGHSLLAVRLLNQIESALGTDISIQTLFQMPTIAKLALAVSDAHRLPLDHSTPRLVALARTNGRLMNDIIGELTHSSDGGISSLPHSEAAHSGDVV
jgi:acyl carrier protein